ncbi:MAG: hypothetical protein Q9157_003190 [Trypethelium eluteriae]
MEMSSSGKSERPVTIFPRYAAVSEGAGQEAKGDEASQFTKGPGKEARKLTKPAPERKTIPRIPVFVRPSSNNFPSNPSAIRQSGHLKTTQGSPWDAYRQLLCEDQAGPATFACLKNPSFAVSVVKEHRHSLSGALSLRSVSHPNIVEIVEAFLKEDTIYLVYGVMTVSLREIKASPIGDLAEYELAAVCKEVLCGLQYIHSTLKLPHGNVDSSNILLSKKGEIKLANIGLSMIRAGSIEETAKDLKDVGVILLEFMEPASADLHGQKLTLTNKSKWSTLIQDFLFKTNDIQLNQLRRVVRTPPLIQQA